MGIRKISSLLHIPEEKKGDEKELLNNLGIHIFLPELDFPEVSDYYVTRRRLGVKEKFMSRLSLTPKEDFFNRLPKNAGVCEYTIINKLIDPPQNIICLMGGVGCGKTMTVHFIKQILENVPKHCKNPGCKKKRLHIIIDFDQGPPFKDTSNRKYAQSKFAECLADTMKSNLHKTIRYEEEIEFVEFWAHEMKKQAKELGLQSAFSKIQNRMRQKCGVNWEEMTNDEGIRVRKEVLDEIENEPSLFLDYQCRLWHFALEKFYNKNRLCVLVVIDNVDRASPTVQGVVRDTLISHRRRFGNTFLVCLRPDTLMAEPVGDAGQIIDVIRHCGPEPYGVMIDRLRRFVENSEDYLESQKLPENIEDHARKLGKVIYNHLNKDRTETMKRFIENIAGDNIRTALLLATGIFTFERSEEHEFTSHPLNRAMISPPYEFYESYPKSAVENIFRVRGVTEAKGLLVKLRILRYLNGSDEKEKLISDLITIPGFFDYSRDLIRKACNDLMEPAHQLIISNTKSGKIGYKSSEFWGSYNDRFILTKMGEGYNNLIGDLDYISKVIPDCYVESNDIPTSLRYEHLLQRFKLILSFLRILHNRDCEETRKFIMTSDRKMYIRHFGKTMLTWDIIRDTSVSFSNILRSLEMIEDRPRHLKYLDDAKLRSEMVDTYVSIEELLNFAASHNEEILDEKVEHTPLRPFSEILRREVEREISVV